MGVITIDLSKYKDEEGNLVYEQFYNRLKELRDEHYYS